MRSRSLYRYYAPHDVVIPLYHFELNPDVSSLFLRGARGKMIAKECPDRVVHTPCQ